MLRRLIGDIWEWERMVEDSKAITLMIPFSFFSFKGKSYQQCISPVFNLISSLSQVITCKPLVIYLAVSTALATTNLIFAYSFPFTPFPVSENTQLLRSSSSDVSTPSITTTTRIGGWAHRNTRSRIILVL